MEDNDLRGNCTAYEFHTDREKKIRQIIGGAGLIYLFAITLGGILHVIYYYTFAGFALRGQGVSWVLVGVGGVMFAPLLQSMIKVYPKDYILRRPEQ